MSSQRIFEIRDAAVQVQDAPDARPLPPIHGYVELTDVYFRYRPCLPQPLEQGDSAHGAERSRAVGLVARNAADRVSPPRDRRPPIKTWDTADMRRFLAVAEDDGDNPVWLLALHSGMRRVEPLGLPPKARGDDRLSSRRHPATVHNSWPSLTRLSWRT